jgi:hypothetical protein
MSSIINKKNHSIQLIHIIIFHWIGQYKQNNDKKKITFSKKYNYNGCILVLPSTETHTMNLQFN